MTGSWCFTVTIHWQPPPPSPSPPQDWKLFFLFSLFTSMNVNHQHQHQKKSYAIAERHWMDVSLEKGFKLSRCAAATSHAGTLENTSHPPPERLFLIRCSVLHPLPASSSCHLPLAIVQPTSLITSSWFPSRFIYAHFECAHNKTGRGVKAFTLGGGEGGDILMEKRYC